MNSDEPDRSWNVRRNLTAIRTLGTNGLTRKITAKSEALCIELRGAFNMSRARSFLKGFQVFKKNYAIHFFSMEIMKKKTNQISIKSCIANTELFSIWNNNCSTFQLLTKFTYVLTFRILFYYANQSDCLCWNRIGNEKIIMKDLN